MPYLGSGASPCLGEYLVGAAIRGDRAAPSAPEPARPWFLNGPVSYHAVALLLAARFGPSQSPIAPRLLSFVTARNYGRRTRHGITAEVVR